MSKIRKALVGDWETTGIPDEFSSEPYLTGPQGIQGAFAVVHDIYGSWEVVDEFQMTIKWLGPDKDKSEVEMPGLTWDEKAFQIHGMSKTYLRDKLSPTDLAYSYRSFIRKHFRNYEPIMFCGHNPWFDMYFNRQFNLFAGLEDEIRYNHRMIDSFTAGLVVAGAHGSDELFSIAGCPPRDKHDAMEDVRHTVRAMRYIVGKVGGIAIPE